MALPFDDDAQHYTDPALQERRTSINFNFVGALVLCEQNRLLSLCFGLSQGIKV